MAGDWLKVEKETPEKPEVLEMAGLLGMDPEKVFAKCFKFWRWGDSHTTDGHAKGVTLERIDELVSAPGFADALTRVGWLHVRSGAVQIPDFGTHMGQSGKKRALTARRVAAHRAANPQGPRNAEVTPDALPREEKSREEKKTKEPPPPPRGGGGGPEEFLRAWNAIPEFRSAKKLTAKRLAAFRARAREPDWAANWRAALDRAANSPFCTGHGERGWKADVDWFLKPDTVTKILEGVYDRLRNGRPSVAGRMAQNLADFVNNGDAGDEPRRICPDRCLPFPGDEPGDAPDPG